MTPSIPNNTAVPRDWRNSAPAPVATARGATPKMNENEVSICSDAVPPNHRESFAKLCGPLLEEVLSQLALLINALDELSPL